MGVRVAGSCYRHLWGDRASRGSGWVIENQELPPQLFRNQNPCFRSSASLLVYLASRWAGGPSETFSRPPRAPLPEVRCPGNCAYRCLGRWPPPGTSVAGCIRRALLQEAPARRCRSACGARASVSHQAHVSSTKRAACAFLFWCAWLVCAYRCVVPRRVRSVSRPP